MKILKNEIELRTVQDWFDHAPPKGGAAQWRDGRSAKECAICWYGEDGGPAVPAELRSLLDSHDLTKGCDLVSGIPEHQVRFDRLRGEPRNADFAAVANRGTDRIAISIEAKADEPFDRYVGELLSHTIDRTSHGVRSNLVKRIEDLSAALLPQPGRGKPGLVDIRCQLLTGIAGAVAYGIEQEASLAVFIVHEFVSNATEDDAHAQNAADLDCFIRRFSDRAFDRISPGELLGPIQIPGQPLFDSAPPILIGKAVRNLRAV